MVYETCDDCDCIMQRRKTKYCTLCCDILCKECFADHNIQCGKCGTHICTFYGIYIYEHNGIGLRGILVKLCSECKTYFEK